MLTVALTRVCHVTAIRVLIVDNEDLFRQMLRTQLSLSSEIEVVGEASSGQEAIGQAESLEPEVVLMDIELGSQPNGIEASKVIKSAAPTTGIVLLSMHNDKQFVESTIRESPSGWSYLLKKNLRDMSTVVRAITGAAWGIVVVDPELVGDLKPRADTPLSRLSPDQLATLDLLAQGFSNSAIAVKLRVEDEAAVQQQIDAIYSDMQIPTDDEADPRVKAVLSYLDQSRTKQAGV